MKDALEAVERVRPASVRNAHDAADRNSAEGRVGSIARAKMAAPGLSTKPVWPRQEWRTSCRRPYKPRPASFEG
jgi:hypothetical protein